jgi:metal-sulfur cluster biosynthetic enzyme
MTISEEQAMNALKSVEYPGFTRDIVSFGLVKSVNIDNGEVNVQLALATNDPNVPGTIKNDAEKALHAIEDVRSAKVLIDLHAPYAGSGAGVGATRIPVIKHVIAVATGKAVSANELWQLTWRLRSSKATRASVCVIATSTARAFRSCSARVRGRWQRKKTKSSRSNNTGCG